MERAEIEKNYASKLKQWAAKWNNVIEKGIYLGNFLPNCLEPKWSGVMQLSQDILYFFYIFHVGPEYGTMEAAWKAVLVESDRRCDLHNRVKEDLQMKVNNQLKLWQKENYHKVIIKLTIPEGVKRLI